MSTVIGVASVQEGKLWSGDKSHSWYYVLKSQKKKSNIKSWKKRKIKIYTYLPSNLISNHFSIVKICFLQNSSYISFLVRSGSLLEFWPDILTRSIISVSTKRSLPFLSNDSGSSNVVIDYDLVNQVFETWLRVLPESHRLNAVEKCLDHMPGNLPLLLRWTLLCLLVHSLYIL